MLSLYMKLSQKTDQTVRGANYFSKGAGSKRRQLCPRANLAAGPSELDEPPVASIQNLIQYARSSTSTVPPLYNLVLVSCAEDVRYSSELWSCKGKEALAASSSSWNARASDICPGYSERIVTCFRTGPMDMTVKWRVRWVPPQLVWLERLGRWWPGVDVAFYDVLDRYGQVVSFSWRQLWRLFSIAVQTGVLRIPESALEGASEITVNAETGAVESIREVVWLVSTFRNGKVKNRRIARDMLRWLEVRQPAGVPFGDWNDVVMRELQIDDVPGMGQFDIDGLDEGQRGTAYADAAAALAVLTVLVLSLGISYAAVHFGHIGDLDNIDNEMMRQWIQTATGLE